jgi:hypothetical protein
LWVKCDGCRQIIWKKDLEENLNVCPKCDKHFRIDARARLAQLLDDNQYEIFDSNLASTDPLKFVDLKAYSSRLKQAKSDTGLKDAIINARGKLNGRPVIVSSMEYSFIGGSMGAVVGEAITRAIEKAVETRTPIIIVSASGGARMMEGVISLMQLAKSPPRWRVWTRLASPLHFGSDRSHHRRSDRIVCHVGRSQYRRTRRPDRLRRPASHRADDPAEAAARFPALRISAGTRNARRRSSPQRFEALYSAGTGFYGAGGVEQRCKRCSSFAGRHLRESRQLFPSSAHAGALGC